MNKSDLLFLMLPIVTVIVSIPMLLGLVRPNGLYGFRTRESMADPKIWYASNRTAAQNLIGASVVSVVIYFVCRLIFKNQNAQVLAGVVCFSVLLLGAVILTQHQTIQLTRNGGPANNIMNK